VSFDEACASGWAFKSGGGKTEIYNKDLRKLGVGINAPNLQIKHAPVCSNLVFFLRKRVGFCPTCVGWVLGLTYPDPHRPINKPKKRKEKEIKK
jgi:hypothetical protein